MAFKVELQGFREFESKVRALGRSVRQETGPVLLSGATILQGFVRQEAAFSSLTGAMQRAIVAKMRERGGDEAVAYMAVDLKKLSKRDKGGKIIPYPYFVESGVRPHAITAKAGGSLFYKGTFRERVKHPGFRGRQFFRRGVARGRYAAKRDMEAKLIAMALRLGASDSGI